ncbi:MAG: glycosyltransferase family 9 protein [Candidatus Eisenbacteria sp.]|nr:glycosyltransferase family 9 protein [Candidatus Eisenbacteria bacterium]
MSERSAPPGGAPSAPAWPADEWQGPVLAVRLSSLGDVALTTGPLGLLRRRRPDLEIDLLTRRAFAPALAGNPDRCGVRIADGEAAPGRRYGTVLDWQGGARGRRAAQRYAPGARRIGAPRASLHRRLLVWGGQRIPAPEPFVVRLARSIAGARVALDELVPRIVAEPAWREWSAARLGSRPRPEAGWVALAPGAAHRQKAIPERLIAEVTEGLLASGWGVVRIVPPERGQQTPVCASEGGEGAWRFAGDLAPVIALLDQVQLFVGSDSGLLHVATGVGTPAIGIYGSTVPALGYAPLGHARAIGVDLACRPCHIHGADRCWLGHRRCWSELRAAQVWEAVRALLPQASLPE